MKLFGHRQTCDPAYSAFSEFTPKSSQNAPRLSLFLFPDLPEKPNPRSCHLELNDPHRKAKSTGV